MKPIDDVDKKILRILQRNSRTPISQISKEVSMSQPSVKERIVKLEENYVISGYTITLNLREMERGTNAFILLKTELCRQLEAFCEQAPEVSDLVRISGEYNYLIKLQVPSVKELAEFQDAIMKFGPSKSHIGTKNIIENRVIL